MMMAVKKSTRNGLPERFPIPGSRIWLTDKKGMELYENVALKFPGKVKDNMDGKARYMAFNRLLLQLKSEGRLWHTDGASFKK